MDTDHDGISFWASQQYEGETGGYFRVRKVGGSIVEAFPGDFGKYHRYDFSVGFALDVPDYAANEEFVVFPNPGNDKIRVEFIGQLGNSENFLVIAMFVGNHQNGKQNQKHYESPVFGSIFVQKKSCFQYAINTFFHFILNFFCYS
jgi:hypothetical protein